MFGSFRHGSKGMVRSKLPPAFVVNSNDLSANQLAAERAHRKKVNISHHIKPFGGNAVERGEEEVAGGAKNVVHRDNLPQQATNQNNNSIQFNSIQFNGCKNHYNNKSIAPTDSTTQAAASATIATTTSRPQLPQQNGQSNKQTN